MKLLYLSIVWIICLGYIGFNLYQKDRLGRIISTLIIIAAVTFTSVILSS